MADPNPTPAEVIRAVLENIASGNGDTPEDLKTTVEEIVNGEIVTGNGQ